MADFRIMHYLVLGYMVAAVASQAVDPSVLTDIFGPPPTPAPSNNPTTPRLEDITVRPTETPSVFTDKSGQSCQCVPYYLCDSNKVGVNINSSEITGFNLLDIRFGEDTPRQCQESVEICCTVPMDPSTPKPQPDPKKVPECGYRNPQGLQVTITGGSGSEAQFGEFPWVAAIMDAQNGSYGGVAVIIHPQVVMTGAHIAAKYAPGRMKIRAGEWDTQTTKEIYDFQERNVEEVYIHSDFQPKSLKNDIALLRLSQPLQLAEHINVLCMPEQDESFSSHKNCVANGWGKDVFGKQGRYAVILKKVDVDMVTHSRCSELLRRTRLGTNFKLHDSFVCAGGEKGRDTCQGDGGAPLACPIGNNRYKLAGLVAWGIGCGEQGVPAVYVNVPAFRDWVDDKMEQWGYKASSYRISE